MRFSMGFGIHLLLFLGFLSSLSNGCIQNPANTSTSPASSAPIDLSNVKQISWRPRGFVCKEILTDEDCDRSINLAADKLNSSMVADNETKSNFLHNAQEKIGATVAALTGLPTSNVSNVVLVELLSFSKCKRNSSHSRPQFRVRTEKLFKYPNTTVGKNTLVTLHALIVFVTNFTKVKDGRGGCSVVIAHMYTYSSSVTLVPRPKGDERSPRAKQGFAEQLKKGNALLFFNLHLNTNRYQNTEEANGHSRRCIDRDPECNKWMAVGGCEGNVLPMAIFCQFTCKLCKP